MKTFIKVTEIWIPDKTRTCLEFSAGLYGALTAFKAVSEQQQFAYDEGLPGKAWAAGHPIMLKSFESGNFKRIEAARTVGLTSGVAIPIFSGDFLLAVVVFLCGDDEEHAGAIEIWSNPAGSNDELNLLDGYYGTLQYFEAMSRQIRLSKMQGLAGIAWATDMPVLVEDISTGAFIRAKDAQQAGISMGIGIPVSDTLGQTYIMTFLSAKTTPIAKRIQIWIPDQHGKYLVCQEGYGKANQELAKIFETLTIEKGSGALGRVWLTGMPVISGAPEFNHLEPDYLSSMLAIPVIRHGRLKAIVSFLF